MAVVSGIFINGRRLKPSTIKKFEQYYLNGVHNSKELLVFINKNWTNYKLWSNAKEKEVI